MEKRLNENPTRLQGIIWIYAAFPLAILLFSLLLSPGWSDVYFFAVTAIMIVGGVAFFQWQSSWGTGKRWIWWLTDAGLKRIDALGGTVVIRWQDIQQISSLKYFGLIIRWSQSAAGNSSLQETVRTRLGLSESDSREVLSLWKEKRLADQVARPEPVPTPTGHRAGFAVMIGGLILTAAISVYAFQSCRSYYWPSISGKIVSSHCEIKPRTRYKMAEMGEISLSYEYTVAGHTYLSDQIRPTSKHYRREGNIIRAFATEHQMGSAVKVFYDPRNPSNAVILPGPDWIVAGFLLPLGPLVFLLGIVIKRSWN